MSLRDIPVDTQLAVWGYCVQGDVLERGALHAEARRDRGVDLTRDDWDVTAADLARTQRWQDGQLVETPAWWALSWWCHEWVDLMGEILE